MRKRIISLGVMALLFAACSVNEMDIATPTAKDAEEFFATIEDASTRVFVDDDLMVLWHADDRVSIFNKYTYNQQYRFTGNTGANSGSFTKVPNDDFVTGNALNSVYAIYPYKESTEISNQGVLTIDLPATQSYAENSFGVGANTMVSCSEGNELLFKNLCGYIMLKLYGDNVTVKSISIKGNNDESLAGKATVNASIDNAPTMTFDASATKEITLTFDTPVTLGTTAENATTFWLVVPPTTFSKGITLAVKDNKNGEFTKSTTASLQISRNTVKRMTALKAEPVAPPIPVQSISLNKTELNLPVGKPETLIATVLPDDATDKTVIWSSTNPNIASVDSYGKVTAINMGSTTILAEAGGKSATCSVTVTVADENSPIQFADEKLKTRLVAKFDSDGDGELSYAEAAAVTSIEGAITIKTITSFDEFQYFTGVSIIPNECFKDWINLSSIILPSSITSIGENAFYNCPKLGSIVLSDILTDIGQYAFYGCSSLVNCIIPNEVASIGNSAFRNCTSLTSCIIPQRVTMIEPFLFYNCENLSSVSLPNGIASIGDFSFEYCSNLSEIHIPESVSSIGRDAFNGCKKITTIFIPKNVASIGFMAFDSCSSLSTITVDPNNPIYDSRDNCNAIIETESNTLLRGSANSFIPESVTSIYDYAFTSCIGLTYIFIPETVTSIGRDAFSECTGLISVNIPESVSMIQYDTFAFCSSLTSISIPESITSIQTNAFYCCTGLTSITVYPSTPPNKGERIFGYTNNCPIYVPAESVEAYKTHYQWSEYADRIFAIGTSH